MTKKAHISGADARGYGRLAVDATLGLTRLVETLHHNILRRPGILGVATDAPTRGITGFVYKSIRGVTRVVGGGLDVVLAQLAKLFEDAAPSPQREAVVAALNGVFGDHLAATGNPLAIPMRLRRDGQALTLTRGGLRQAIPHATGKVLVLAHGLCMNDLRWRRHGHDHGAALAADAGYTPVYLHYNSGLHVAANGAEFADRIEALLCAWPVPVEELTIIAHSAGGLVARSACQHAAIARQRWLRRLHTMVFLGTPHFGAPLERGGGWVDTLLGASPYTTAFARLGKLRSAGITDLRHGSVLDEHTRQAGGATPGSARHTLALPPHVRCYAIAASLAPKSAKLATRLLGDGLVPLPSALGQHKDARRSLAIPADRLCIAYGTGHLDLLDRAAVYAQIRRWLVAAPD